MTQSNNTEWLQKSDDIKWCHKLMTHMDDTKRWQKIKIKIDDTKWWHKVMPQNYDT